MKKALEVENENCNMHTPIDLPTSRTQFFFHEREARVVDFLFSAAKVSKKATTRTGNEKRRTLRKSNTPMAGNDCTLYITILFLLHFYSLCDLHV